MSFKTQKEIFEALISGKKIKHKLAANHFFVHLVDGSARYSDSSRSGCVFDQPSDWSLYEEPKKMKTVTLCRYTYKSNEGITQTQWTTKLFEDYFMANIATLLKTESKTLEIEDV